MRTLGKPFNLLGRDVMDAAIAAKIVLTPGTCTGYESSRSGSLASGGTAYQPDNTYYQSLSPGTHQGCLDGPTGTNLDLFLQKWNGSTWNDVANSAGTGPDEALTYSGTAGYYRYRVYAASGSGAYALGYNAP
jgi:streptogrisin C